MAQEINNNELDSSLAKQPSAKPPVQHQTQPAPPPLTAGGQDDDGGANDKNNSPKGQADMVGTTCMELALEGERLCQTGDLKNGVKFFEEAIKVGTTDDRTLSAIYSQLGNAYFYLEDYQKALEYHKQDVTLVHSIGDEAAEAKACGNLGNTFKMLGKFDKAAIHCKRYLEISRKLQDEVGEGRALYNLGNVYHMQGKRMIGTSEQESGELPHDIKSSLQRAIEYYEANLKVVSRLHDNVAMGRAYGNLGNTHYLLGNFQAAVDAHKKRLELAKQTSDKSAERRAYLNLGNANVFLGNFREAIDNYSSTLKLAQELNDKHTEAHSCYSVANTYTFLRDYKSAIHYHRKYIELIKELDDKLGEGRACWSLVNIYQMVNDPESALVYAKKHHEIAELLGDESGLTSARANIEELEDTILQKQAIQAGQSNAAVSSASQIAITACGRDELTGRKLAAGSLTTNNLAARLSPDKRQEQEQRRFKKQLNSNLNADIDGLAAARRRGKGALVRSSSSERLFDMIAHFQSGRIDDQRCEILKRPQATSAAGSNSTVKTTRASSDDKENLGSQARPQRASLASNDLASTPANGGANGPRASQPSITNPMNAVSAAASAIKATYRKASLVAYPTTHSFANIQAQRRPTVSAEHRDELFNLIASAQRQRMDEQRASMPVLTIGNGVLRNPTNANLLSRAETIDQSSTHASGSTGKAIKPDTIYEGAMARRAKERSHSIAPSHLHHLSSSTSSSNTTGTTQVNANNYSPMPTSNASLNQPQTNSTTAIRPKLHKLSRHFQTMDAGRAPVQDEKFLDSLMKYQSTRFNDQRSEFPKTRDNSASTNPGKHSENEKGQVDNFFNLIVKFQSDRIDDQRSAPPTRNKNP